MRKFAGLVWLGVALAAVALMVRLPVRSAPVSPVVQVTPVPKPQPTPKFVPYLNINGVYLGMTRAQVKALHPFFGKLGLHSVDYDTSGHVVAVSGSVLFDRKGMVADWNYDQSLVVQALGKPTHHLAGDGIRDIEYDWGQTHFKDAMTHGLRDRTFSLWSGRHIPTYLLVPYSKMDVDTESPTPSPTVYGTPQE